MTVDLMGSRQPAEIQVLLALLPAMTSVSAYNFKTASHAKQHEIAASSMVPDPLVPTPALPGRILH